jgi:hypothetical protein
MINEDGSCVSLADARTFAFHQDPYKARVTTSAHNFALPIFDLFEVCFTAVFQFCFYACFLVSLFAFDSYPPPSPPPPPVLLFQDGIYMAGWQFIHSQQFNASQPLASASVLHIKRLFSGFNGDAVDNIQRYSVNL